MSTPQQYGQVQQAVKTWLVGSDVASKVTRTDGKVDIYLAMPKSNPSPVLLINLIGGGPSNRGDLPTSRYRFSFDVIAKTRTEAEAIYMALMSELVWLGQGGPGVIAEGVYLGAADVLNVRWQPDPDSDTPRYIVDALITTVL